MRRGRGEAFRARHEKYRVLVRSFHTVQVPKLTQREREDNQTHTAVLNDTQDGPTRRSCTWVRGQRRRKEKGCRPCAPKTAAMIHHPSTLQYRLSYANIRETLRDRTERARKGESTTSVDGVATGKADIRRFVWASGIRERDREMEGYPRNTNRRLVCDHSDLTTDSDFSRTEAPEARRSGGASAARRQRQHRRPASASCQSR